MKKIAKANKGWNIFLNQHPSFAVFNLQLIFILSLVLIIGQNHDRPLYNQK